MHKYGIYEERSDIRAHVSLPGKRITVFKTSDMVALLGCRKYRQIMGYQPGIEYPTAKGFIVPLEDISPQYVLESRKFPWHEYDESKLDCEAKGQMAVACVISAIKANRFPLWVSGRINGNKELDIEGTDVIVTASRHIQVKYDGLAYPVSQGGSGNLFIQTHECNPLKLR